ncbi:MAG TPA: hypothetical protein DD638_12350, partial [Pasteurellaceae bacterium]|nr:hypothetical protein [Pasteurellaceae bacterium]
MNKSLIALFATLAAFSVHATNTQTVTVTGSVVNKSDSAGQALINVGSAVGREVGRNNDQTVIVNGSIAN